MIAEYSAYLDVSFLALSEDKFFTVIKKVGDYARYPKVSAGRKQTSSLDFNMWGILIITSSASSGMVQGARCGEDPPETFIQPRQWLLLSAVPRE